jgi:hypothetical protein
LFEDRRVLNLPFDRQQQDLTDLFGGARIVVGERKKQAAAMLCGDGGHAQPPAWSLMDDVGTEMDEVMAVIPMVKGVSAVDMDIVQFQ